MALKIQISILFLLLTAISGQFQGDYTIGTVSTSAVTNDIEDGVEVSRCTCDITGSNCDISCCCDSDCPSATLSLWLDDATAFCNNDLQSELQPLTKCINRDYLAYWNDRPGISIDDNDSKDDICVELDEQPKYATFYDEISEDASGYTTLLDRWFEWEDSSDDQIDEIFADDADNEITLYNIGDEITHYDSTRGIRMNFPLPQADLFERCDFSSPATFYSEVEVECEYVITSLDECTTILSAETYSAFTVTADQSTTDVITTSIGSTSTDPATAAGADCSNTLRTLKLEFYFSEPSAAGFTLSRVTMDYEVDAAAKSVGDVVTLDVITKFYKDTTSTITRKSGNPGYLAGEMELLADSSSGSIELSGFRKEIASDTGECLTAAAPGLTTITENYLEFYEDINMQCNVTVASEADFQAQCTDTAYESLYMFKQFDKFGMYGTAKASVSSDWTDVITQAITNSANYDSATKTCQNMITTIQYEVMVSYHGYEDDLQYYIAAINAKPLQEDVTYTTDTHYTGVPYRVIFTHYLVLPEDIRYDEKIPYEFPPDLGGSTASTVGRDESSNSDEP